MVRVTLYHFITAFKERWSWVSSGCPQSFLKASSDGEGQTINNKFSAYPCLAPQRQEKKAFPQKAKKKAVYRLGIYSNVSVTFSAYFAAPHKTPRKKSRDDSPSFPELAHISCSAGEKASQHPCNRRCHHAQQSLS